MKRTKYPKGTMILEENSEGEDIFFIVTGKVNIFKTINDEKVDLAVLGEKDFFGEMSMFLQHKRSASVEALEDCEIIVGNKQEFINAIKENPNKAIRIISTMAKRLQAAHKFISSLEGQVKGFKILLTPFGSDDDDQHE